MSPLASSPKPGRPRWFRRHPVATFAVMNLVLLVVLGGVFEIFFRRQTVDFYARELVAFNRPAVLSASTPPAVVVLGDSFAAGQRSFSGFLEIAEPERPWRVVNSAVPGTTITHAAAMAARRLDRFEPSVVIYQTYVGNDLLDLRHPVSWRRVGPARNLYWLLNDHGATALGLMNYRLGQAWNRVQVEWWWDADSRSSAHLAAVRARPFSVAEYRRREKMLLAADPRVIHDQIALEGGMEAAWYRYREALERLIAHCEERGIPLVVLAVPHCVQVGDRYRQRFAALGADFPSPELLEAPIYPFLERLREVASTHDLVRVVDPLAELRRADILGPPVYLNNDAHLSDHGQTVLTDLLRMRLSECIGRE